MDDVLIPVFIPDTIISLRVPPKIMAEAIGNFNTRVQEESLFIKTDEENIEASITELVRSGDNLFLTMITPDHNRKKLSRLAARLMGYAVIHKETGVVEDLVIEGFKFAKSINVEDML